MECVVNCMCSTIIILCVGKVFETLISRRKCLNQGKLPRKFDVIGHEMDLIAMSINIIGLVSSTKSPYSVVQSEGC